VEDLVLKRLKNNVYALGSGRETAPRKQPGCVSFCGEAFRNRPVKSLTTLCRSQDISEAFKPMLFLLTRTMDCLSDEIVAKAQRGDEEAFATIYELHKSRVYAICLRWTSNPTDAEDLTQEVFLHLFRFIHTFRWQAKFSTWLHRVAVSVVIWKLRPKRIEATSLEQLGGTGESYRIDFGAEDSHVGNAVDRLTIERALDDLPRGCRAIFILHDVLGYEHREIARITGTSMGNSKSQLHKARLKLREAMLRKARNQRCSYAFPVKPLIVCATSAS
jgi:RNA polymerase sigma-70 factor (ECF subfamily)